MYAALPADRERRHPRVHVGLPVELRSGLLLAVGSTEDLSVGGMLLASPVQLEGDRDVWLRFNLPNGHSVRVRSRVVHRRADGKFGLRFGELATSDHVALTEILGTLLGYTRRGEREARRLHVTLCAEGSPASEQELAETMILSRRGGLLLSRAHFKLHARLQVTWPERHKSAAAQIVYRRLAGPGGLSEFGFMFADTEDFWELGVDTR